MIIMNQNRSVSKMYRKQKRELLKEINTMTYDLNALPDTKIEKIDLKFLMKTKMDLKTILNTLNVDYGYVGEPHICSFDADATPKTLQKN